MVAVAGLAGCTSGPPTGEVRGKVTFKQKAVSEGKVTFVNPSGPGGGEGLLRKDGSYEIQGALVAGDYIVIVSPLMHMVDTDPGKTPPSPEEKPAPDIPAKYRSEGSSPFKATVKPGKNEFNFDMKP